MTRELDRLAHPALVDRTHSEGQPGCPVVQLPARFFRLPGVMYRLQRLAARGSLKLQTLYFPAARSKRSRFITLSHAATKSRTNVPFESSHA